MGLTDGDYWVQGSDLPSAELVTDLGAQLAQYHPGSRAAKDTAELLACLVRARELTDALAHVSMGYGYDLGNNRDGSGPNTARRPRVRDMSDLTWRVERHRGPCKCCGGTGFCWKAQTHPECYDGCTAAEDKPSCLRCGESMSWNGDRWLCSNEGTVESVGCPDCRGMSGGTVLIGTQVSAHHADGSTAWVSGLFQGGPELRAACAQSGLLTVADAIELGAQIRAAVGA